MGGRDVMSWTHVMRRTHVMGVVVGWGHAGDVYERLLRLRRQMLSHLLSHLRLTQQVIIVADRRVADGRVARGMGVGLG